MLLSRFCRTTNFAALLILTAGAIRAQSPAWNTPIYDPNSKSYFALVERDSAGYLWQDANNEARSRQYKGVQGRLAVVNSLQVHEFLLRTFHPDKEVWIGLRYWCQQHALEDVTGRRHTKADFQAWARKWLADGFACKGGSEYMGVGYSRASYGFGWIGEGIGKGLNAYFIEFPNAR